MRVGIDIRVLSTSRALSRYTKNITDHLLRLGSDDFYYLFSDSRQSLNKLPSIAAGVSGLKYELVAAPKKMVIRDHFLFWDSLKNLNLDIFFHPDNTEFLRCHRRSVVTVHDILPWKMPSYVLSRNPLTRLRQNLYFTLQKKALCESCKKIIAVSENTKKDLVENFNIPSGQIEVIYEGIEEKFHSSNDQNLIEETKKKYKISGSYLLYVGGFEPYKNVERLIQAFGQIYSHNLKLVLVGPHNRDCQRLMILAGDLGMGESVIYPGFIDEEDLPKIYEGAVFLIYPSLYEGFGFPPLESMACGTPVFLSQNASLPEVGGEAAIYFDPESINGLAGSLQTALKHYLNNRVEYDLLSERCRRQASLFSWSKTAEKTRLLFERLVK